MWFVKTRAYLTTEDEPYNRTFNLHLLPLEKIYRELKTFSELRFFTLLDASSLHNLNSSKIVI